MSCDNNHHYISSLINAQTDNDRFAALIMIAKCTKLEDYDEQSRLQLLNAIGSKFLIRLLKTETVPDDCPPDIFKSVAVSILSAVCSDPSLCAHPAVLGSISYLNDILASTMDDDFSDLDKNLEADCFECLQSLAMTEMGREQLLKHGTISVLTNLVTSTKGDERAHRLLFHLVGSCGTNVWTGNTAGCTQLLCYLSREFKNKENEKKFELCDALCLAVSTVSINKIDLSTRIPWIFDIVLTLDGVFRSKIGATQRDAALKLVSVLVNTLGVAAILPPYTDNTKLLLLVTHLTCIEVRMILENSATEEIEKKRLVLMSCYSLLENVITELTTNPATFPSNEQISKLHKSMIGAFGAVIFQLSETAKVFLQEPLTYVTIATVRVLGIWLAEETTALRNEICDILPFLVQICTHCYSLHKDSRSKAKMTNKAHQLDSSDISQSSLMMEGSQSSLMMEGSQSSSSTEIRVQPQEMDSNSHPCIRACASSDNSKNDMAMLEEQDIVKFLLPGFCHLTAEDQSREILLTENFAAFLEEYFADLWRYFMEVGDDSMELKSRLVTVCSNFLNLVVTEPKLAAEHEVFHRLANFVLVSTSDLTYRPDCLVLWANMLTLGALLLRNQESRNDIKKDEMNKFFLSLCSFLSGSFISTGTNKSAKALTVTELYKPYWDDVSQLWFLCMQVLTSCVPIYPECTTAILKSGWLPTTIKVFLDAQCKDVDKETRESLLSLLCAVSSSSAQAKNVVHEKGGLELSRMYSSPELEAILT